METVIRLVTGDFAETSGCRIALLGIANQLVLLKEKLP